MELGTKVKRLGIRILFAAFRHLRIMYACLAFLLLLSVAVLTLFPFQNDIARMLPDGSEAAQTYRLIARSSMFNKAPLLFRSESPDTFRTPAFAAKLEKLAGLLEADRRILRMDYRLVPDSPENMLKELAAYLPQYLPFSEPDAQKLVSGCRKQFLLPSSTGRTKMLAADPFSLSSKQLLRLEHFRRVSRFSVQPDSPYIISPDGHSLLVVLETAVPATDPGTGRALMAFVENCVRSAGFTPGKDVDLLLPHRRAMVNEAVLKKDILLVSILSVIVFIALIIGIYRCDARSFLIPAIPFLSTLFTAALMPLVFPVPLFFIVGMGGIVISLALDYGIHIYSAMTGPGRFSALIKIVMPLFFAVLTSCAAFFLFLFSQTDAIRQLGFFSGTSLLISLILMLLILPPSLAEHRTKVAISIRPLPFLPSRYAWGLWLVLILISVMLLPGLRLYPDVRQFDLSPAEFDEQDERLIRDFQNGCAPAMAIFHGKTADDAIRAASAAETVPDCFSVSELYPPEQIRKKNLSAWRKFETEFWTKFESAIRMQAEQEGFDPEFFAPFLARFREGILHPPEGPPACFRPVLKRLLVRGTDGMWYAAALYPDKPEIRNALASLSGAMVISRERFSTALARDILNGILPLAASAVCAVIFLTWLYFRSLEKTFFALIPVLSALLCTGALFSALNKPVNIPVLMAGIILCGLAVDYGIFAVHAVQTGNCRNIFRAVTLSALTTAAGGLTVVFTRHPMLRDAGQTLIAGIAFAWFTALFLLPPFMSGKNRNRLLTVLVCFICLLTGCHTQPFAYENFPDADEVISSRTCKPFPEQFAFTGSVVMETPFFSMNFLCTAERKNEAFRIAGLSPAGMKLLEIAGTKGKAEEFYFFPGGKMPADPRKTADWILSRFESVFTGLGPYSGTLPDSFCGKKTILELDGVSRAGRNLDVIRKGDTGYFLYRDFGRYRFPVHIVHRGGAGCQMIFRISDVSPD